MTRNHSYYSVLTPAGSYPVTLAEAKAYLRVTNTAEDTLITALIESATNVCEKYTNRIFVETTFRGQFSNLVVSKTESWPFLELARSPLESITDFEELVDGVWTSVDTDYWALRDLSGYSRILVDPVSITLAVDNEVIPYLFRVDFVAGYDPVPESIKTAIKATINYAYTNRGDCGACNDYGPKVPDEAKLMLNKYVARRVF